MKDLIKTIILSALIAGIGAEASVYVNGYYKNNGTYVDSHYRSNPDKSIYNNKSYRGY